MTTEADKITAELMALADAYAGQAYLRRLEGSGIEQASRAALEQAIRRAVDWGEPVAAVTADQCLRWLISKEEAAERGGLFGQPLYARSTKP